jgi:hypothetical protein
MAIGEVGYSRDGSFVREVPELVSSSKPDSTSVSEHFLIFLCKCRYPAYRRSGLIVRVVILWVEWHDRGHSVHSDIRVVCADPTAQMLISMPDLWI